MSLTNTCIWVLNNAVVSDLSWIPLLVIYHRDFGFQEGRLHDTSAAVDIGCLVHIQSFYPLDAPGTNSICMFRLAGMYHCSTNPTVQVASPPWCIPCSPRGTRLCYSSDCSNGLIDLLDLECVYELITPWLNHMATWILVIITSGWHRCLTVPSHNLNQFWTWMDIFDILWSSISPENIAWENYISEVFSWFLRNILEQSRKSCTSDRNK